MSHASQLIVSFLFWLLEEKRKVFMINKAILNVIRSVVWLLDAVHTIITGGWRTCIWRIVNILEILLCRWKWKWRRQQWGGEKEKETQEIY